MRFSELKPVFLTFIPKTLEPGIIYISEEYKCTIHLCACGCGIKTVLPLGVDEWTMIKQDNNVVTFSPSIGNWQLPCRSHYNITDNKIIWHADSGK